jgi:predicted transcriptional regulator YdeE
MTIVSITEKVISGLSARTNNKDEMSQETGKISRLVQRFDQATTVNYKDGARVYIVYYDYESDASGEYSLLVGADAVESATVALEQKTIQAGKYLVFFGQGQVPQVVFETWKKVWQYFSDENSEFKRAYTTDFEFYKDQNTIEIHIAIK